MEIVTHLIDNIYYKNIFSNIGFLFIPLFFFSIITIGIIFERLFFLLFKKNFSKNDIKDIKKSIEKNDHNILNKNIIKNYFFQYIHELLKDKSLSKKNRYKLIDEINDQIYYDCTRYLSFLKLIASISPILGLLGTVTGMIEAFDKISHETGPVTPSLIASGISKALLTTLYGLTISLFAFFFQKIFLILIELKLKIFNLQINEINTKISQIFSSNSVNLERFIKILKLLEKNETEIIKLIKNKNES